MGVDFEQTPPLVYAEQTGPRRPESARATAACPGSCVGIVGPQGQVTAGSGTANNTPRFPRGPEGRKFETGVAGARPRRQTAGPAPAGGSGGDSVPRPFPAPTGACTPERLDLFSLPSQKAAPSPPPLRSRGPSLLPSPPLLRSLVITAGPPGPALL